MHDAACNNRPLPALRATLSRKREKGWGRGGAIWLACQLFSRCSIKVLDQIDLNEGLKPR